MGSNNFSLIFSLLIITSFLCSTTTDAYTNFLGNLFGNAAENNEHQPTTYKVAGRRGLLSGFIPKVPVINTNSLAGGFDNLVATPHPPSKGAGHDGSPKGEKTTQNVHPLGIPGQVH
ncbi:PREDICTED: uncharacterized protein LOC109161108 [Ipomoea nil]|uniref:uncharacterized protein LOC109161108 n=1 Tax=Ipomoea nil TaxID=35883 RepID=UPI0009015B8C|nr:PREDICTED: uncharacterized protein LOC109161108 [Ipomoea nil]